MNDESIKCGSCQREFTWADAYKCEETPGSMPHNPPGQGNWRPRVFCPHCGALVAEWHITRQKDFDEWLWFGDNEKYNEGRSLPPSPIVYGWGRNILSQFLPMFNQHRLDVKKINQFRKKRESVSETESKEKEDWKKPFEMAKQFYAKGDIKRVIELIQEAVSVGLPKVEHAEALGVIGDHYLLNEKDVETARKYYESSIETHFSGYWVAHLFLGYMHEAEGDIQNAKKEYDGAKRANPRKQLDSSFEAKVRQIIGKWAEEKLGTSSEADIDELRGKKDVGGLIKALKHDEERIRWTAAKALGEVGDQRATEPLIEALKDEEEDVRWYAAMSLGKIGDERTIEALKQSLQDKSKLVRQFSKNAIDEIKERFKVRSEKTDQMDLGEVGDMKSEDAVIDARQKHEGSDYQQLGKSEDIAEPEYPEPRISISGEGEPRTAYGVKRKLTAILSADVKGYSLLMQEDEVATVRTLTEYRKLMASLIEQLKGRVVDSPGDNMLAEFASVVDAVQCAMEIQKVLRAKNELLPENRRMEFRIGINLGDVIEEGERIYGDGVNIAARIEALAEAGGICISGSAYEQIENKLPLQYMFMGELKVKNIRKRIKVYRAQLEQNSMIREKFSGKSKAGKRSRVLYTLSAICFVTAGLLFWNYFMRPQGQVADRLAQKGVEAIPTKQVVETNAGPFKVELIEQNWNILPAGEKVYVGGKEYSIRQDLAGIDLCLRVTNTSSDRVVIPGWALLDKNKSFLAPFRFTEEDGKKYLDGEIYVNGNKTKLIYLRSTFKSLSSQRKKEPLFLVDKTYNSIWPVARIPDRATLIKNRSAKIKK